MDPKIETPAGDKAGTPAGDQSKGTPAANDTDSRSKAFEAADHWKAQAAAATAKLAEIEAAGRKASEAALAEQGKFKELAETRGAETKQLQELLRDTRVTSALTTAGLKAGLRNPDYIRLVDRSKVKGEGENADDLLKALKEADPSLFGDPTTISVKTGDRPAGGGKGAFDPSKVKPEDVANLTAEEFKAYREAKYGSANPSHIPLPKR